MIYCIWYPSGGFGHFVNSILSYYGDNFVRPNRSPVISTRGVSHILDVVLPKYREEVPYTLPDIDKSKHYSVLIDNGINNESTTFKQVFDPCTVIKICYDDCSWPIIAKRSIVGAMNTSLDSQLPLEGNWPSSEAWAVRERYFLYLTNHPLRHAWRRDQSDCNIDLLSLMSYDQLKALLDMHNIACRDFRELHQSMLEKNKSYIAGIEYARAIVAALKSQRHIDVQCITDLWDQAVVNYFIYCEFGLEIPANDYANWFTNTEEIAKLL